MRTRALALAVLALGALTWVWLRSVPRAGAPVVPNESATAAAEPIAAELRGVDPASEPAPGRSPRESPPPEDPPARPAPGRSAAGPPIGCVLYGRVRASGGEFGSSKPHVALTDAAGVRRQTRVGDDGNYSFSGLEAGTWTLSGSALGFSPLEERLTLRSAEPIVRRDLELKRASLIEVRVLTPSGETFVEASKARERAKLPRPDAPFVVATKERPGAEIPAAASPGEDKVGVGSFWSFGPLMQERNPDVFGVLELSDVPPVFVSLCSGAQVLATQLVETEGAVTFVVDLDELLGLGARVTLRVVADDTGEPLQGSLSVDSRAVYHVHEGSWSQEMLPGEHELTFWASGYVIRPIALTLAPGETRDLGELRLAREVTIEGRLLDDAGNPVSGRLGIGERVEGVVRFRDDGYSLYGTDEDGRYKIFGLVPGRYVLHTVGDDQVRFPARKEPPTEWVSGNVEVSTLEGSVTGFDLHLVRAGVLVLGNAPKLQPDSRCTILDAHGDLLRSSGFYPGFVPRFLLPPGPCTLVLCDADGVELARQALHIGPGVNELDLTR